MEEPRCLEYEIFEICACSLQLATCSLQFVAYNL